MKPISTACLLAIVMVSTDRMLSSTAAQEPWLRQRQITSNSQIHRRETEETLSGARAGRIITDLFVGIILGPPEIVLGVDPEPDKDEQSQEEQYNKVQKNPKTNILGRNNTRYSIEKFRGSGRRMLETLALINSTTTLKEPF